MSERSSSRDSRFLGYALALFVPFSLCAFWHALNSQYPSSDAAQYLLDIFPASKALKQGEFLSALKIGYWIRGGKPILLPGLILPIMSVVSDIRFAVAIFNLIVFAIFLIYTLKFLRMFLPELYAVSSTWFIGTLPWVMMSVFQFLCELSFMTACMVSLYALFNSPDFGSRRAGLLLGVSLSVAFCIQPFVALVGLGCVYFFFVMRAFRLGNIHRTDIQLTSGLSIIAVGVPWTVDSWNMNRLIILVLLWAVIWGLASFYRRIKGLSGNFFWVHSALLTSALLWFAPFYNQLVSWGYSCTYGLAAFFDKLEPWLKIKGFYDEFAGGLLFLLVLLAAANVTKRIKSEEPFPEKYLRQICVAGILLGSILVSCLTRNGEPRYHFFGVTFYIYRLLFSLRAGV